METEEVSPILSKAALPFIWRPTTVRAFLLLFYVGNVLPLVAGPMAVRSAGQFLGLAVGFAVGALVVTAVWPFYRRTLPDQILRRGGRPQAQLCFFAMAIPMFALFAVAPLRTAGPPPMPMGGYIIGVGLFFYRLYRWLDALPE